jgi:hypothetical protein
MTLVISKGITLRKGWQPMDPDAAAYIAAVETADTEPLEEKTKIAIDNFVLGCKADGIWTAIKASCILAGARTLEGALVPLVGTAPTNFNFASGDYDRKTGLVGDASTKYLNSNRNNNADPQNNHHMAIFRTVLGGAALIGAGASSAGSTQIGETGTSVDIRSRSSSLSVNSSTSLNFCGMSRSSSTQVLTRIGGVNTTTSNNSQSSFNGSVLVFGRTDGSGNPGAFSNARMSFYSIGEFLNLALLDARVTDLINAFGAAIP